MDSSQKMDVVDWEDSPPAVAFKTRVPRRFLSPSLVGILGTLLVHALVIESVPWNSGAKIKRPETPESVDALSKSKSDSAESLVLISLPTMALSNQAAAQNTVSSFLDLKKIKIKSTVDADPPAMLNIEALALSDDQVVKQTSGDAAELARSRLDS